MRLRERLFPVLLNARRTQTRKAMLVYRVLPGQEFLDGQRVAVARLFERKQAATDRCHDFRLAADYPAFGPRRGQVRDRQGGTVWPDDVLDPRAMGFGHSDSHELDNATGRTLRTAA